MLKKLLPEVLLISMTAALIFTTHIYLCLTTPTGNGRVVKIINISPGTKFFQVAMELKKEEIIEKINAFSLLAKLKGDTSKIKCGEYELNNNMSPLRILAVLTNGEVVRRRVTIPEGLNFLQVATLLDKTGIVDEEVFIKKVADHLFLTRLNMAGKNLEGYLFPDTYFFTKGMYAEEVIITMINRFQTIFSKDFAVRSKKLGLTEREVVTLASIIEKETANNSEKYLISAVFHNRLKKGIRLQSDPTVIYGLRPFNGNLTRKDLLKKTPYNTYRIGGLPPGPISNPGREAIKAALYPAESKYFYFVSKNNGTHYFSRNLAEHNLAVAKYQRTRKYKRKYKKVLK